MRRCRAKIVDHRNMPSSPNQAEKSCCCEGIASLRQRRKGVACPADFFNETGNCPKADASQEKVGSECLRDEEPEEQKDAGDQYGRDEKRGVPLWRDCEFPHSRPERSQAGPASGNPCQRRPGDARPEQHDGKDHQSGELRHYLTTDKPW